MIPTPFNYTGSKTKLLPQLLPLLDRSKVHFYDVFAGGGSVYANVLPLYPHVHVNDVITDLIGIHRALIEEGESFVAIVRVLCAAKDDPMSYRALRDAYNADKTPSRLFALMLCCTNNMMRFNRSFGFNQTFGKRSFNPSTQAKIDAFIAGVKPYVDRISYSSLRFQEVVPLNPTDSMIYMDPPYIGTEAGYNTYWSQADEETLYAYILKLHASGASFALSGVRGQHRSGKESSRLIERLVADGFECVALDFAYTKVARRKGDTSSQEVVVRNYGARLGG